MTLPPSRLTELFPASWAFDTSIDRSTEWLAKRWDGAQLCLPIARNADAEVY